MRFTSADLVKLTPVAAVVLGLSACSIAEEVKHIEEVQKAEQRQETARSENLTGEQLFVRSCNTCHPGGKAGIGPSLEEINEKIPDDAQLKAIIRKGRGNMPPQSVETINDAELENLVTYLRSLNK
ncbi:MAG: cytochrome c [Candidatus Obscuribacterales bacterium]|nr:cytochrome c [Candidatus Obscuribacterales bacterium]